MTKNNQNAFLALVRAGLWADRGVFQVSSSKFQGSVDWEKVYQLAEEQSVVGLVLAGIERYKNHNLIDNLNISQELLLQWIGEVQMMEQQNKSMNEFVAALIEKLRKEDVYAILVKGQGVAQCYEKPLWRASGDIDLLLDTTNYEKAKEVLFPIAGVVEGEEKTAKHQALNINGFEVELHGRMPFFLSKQVDYVIDETLKDTTDGSLRIWVLNGTDVYLPTPDNDVIIIYTHLLFHFFVEGVGLRQICDWCRLLWHYRSDLDLRLLESRLRKMGLMTEWRAFAALGVEWLGFPEEDMPFYKNGYSNRAKRVLKHILKSGNMGHNNDLIYRAKYSGLTYKLVAFWRRIKDFASFTKIFPLDAPRFFVHYVMRKVLLLP